MYLLSDDSVASFADDSTLYAVHNSPQGLQDNLNSLVNKAQLWFLENGMQSNPTRFQSIFFGNTQPCAISVNTN